MKTDQIQMNTPGEKKIGEYEFNPEDWTPVIPAKRTRRTRRTRKVQDSIIPVLTITHFDCADENGTLHYIGTYGRSVYEIDVIVPEGAEINIVSTIDGFLELLGASVTVRGNKRSTIDGKYITGKGIRIVYSHEYVNYVFVERESNEMMVNIPGDVTE